jgi:hypothetical protein
MAIFDRSNIRLVAAGAWLCAIAIALSPEAAAAPPGGNECFEGKGEVCTASAPLAGMAGIPMALPGPVPAAPVVPVVPAAPAVPVVPAAPPIPVIPMAPPVPVVPAAPVPAAAPLAGGAGFTDVPGLGGKGAPTTGPPPAGAPVPGQPIIPGPSAAGAS